MGVGKGVSTDILGPPPSSYASDPQHLVRFPLQLPNTHLYSLGERHHASESALTNYAWCFQVSYSYSGLND